MRLRLLLSATLFLSATTATALSAQDAPAMVVSAAHLRALGDSLAPAASRTAQLGVGPGYTYAVTHRDSAGGVEAHADWTDVFVIESGSATLLSGGRLDGARETTHGEMRGGTIVGGMHRALKPGDVVVIPAGTAHQMILIGGERISYLAFKIAKPSGA